MAVQDVGLAHGSPHRWTDAISHQLEPGGKAAHFHSIYTFIRGKLRIDIAPGGDNGGIDPEPF